MPFKAALLVLTIAVIGDATLDYCPEGLGGDIYCPEELGSGSSQGDKIDELATMLSENLCNNVTLGIDLFCLFTEEHQRYRIQFYGSCVELGFSAYRLLQYPNDKLQEGNISAIIDKVELSSYYSRPQYMEGSLNIEALEWVCTIYCCCGHRDQVVVTHAPKTKDYDLCRIAEEKSTSAPTETGSNTIPTVGPVGKTGG